MPTIQTSLAPHASSILAIAAHPDDIESWCAGTLAQSIDAGSTVRLVLVTSGDKGSHDPTMERDRLAVIREREATMAAQVLGITDLHFLRHEDGEVEDTRALRGALVEWIRRWRPQVVFTHDPVWPLPTYLAHRDHRIVGRAVLDAVYPAARDPLSFSEHLASGLIPHAVEQVWLFASAQADTSVDIRAGFDRKIAARLAHQSQTPDPRELPRHWRQRAAEIGSSAALPLAESFTILNIT